MNSYSEAYSGDCGDFLADLPRYLQHLGEKTSPHSPLPEHARSCPRCQNNFHTARDIAGAFHGIRTRVAPTMDRGRLLNVERAVSIALRENRSELSELFIEIGRSHLNDATNQTGWIANLSPLQNSQRNLMRGVSIANDSVLMATDTEQKREWDELREGLVATRLPEDRKIALEEAARFFATAQRIAPRSERAAIHVGLAKTSRDAHEEALASYLWVIKEGHSIRRVGEAHINASHCYVETKRFVQAQEHARIGAQFIPEEPTALNNWASAALLAGDRKESFKVWERIESEGDTNTALRERVHGRLRISLGMQGSFRSLLEGDTGLCSELGRLFPKTFSSAFKDNFGEA